MKRKQNNGQVRLTSVKLNSHSPLNVLAETRPIFAYLKSLKFSFYESDLISHLQWFMSGMQKLDEGKGHNWDLWGSCEPLNDISLKERRKRNSGRNSFIHFRKLNIFFKCKTNNIKKLFNYEVVPKVFNFIIFSF